MKSLAALALALSLTAAPALAQPGRGHEQHGGMGGGGHGGGAPAWAGGGDRRGGGFGDPRGGFARDPREGRDAREGYPAYGPAPRNGYAEPRGYGYPGGPPVADRRGPDSLGADWGGQQDEARAGVRQGRYVGLARVIGNIRQRSPGRQLDAGLEQWGGRAVYRVRWAAPGGRRTDYIVDAQSGAILHVDGR